MTQTERQRVWYQANKERIKANHRAFYQRHKEQILADQKKRRDPEWYSKHKEQARAKARRYYWAHRDEQRAQQHVHYQEQRVAVLEHYGKKCACCGEAQPEFLAIDHVNNDGAEHRRSVHSGKHIIRWLIQNNFPDGFQVLCFNCNMAKSVYGICPHQEVRNGTYETIGNTKC